MRWFQALSFKMRFILSAAFSSTVSGVIAISTAIHFNDIEFREGLISKARTIHGRLDVAAKYVSKQGGLATMIEKYTQMYQNPRQLKEEDKSIILQNVPIYAAMSVGSTNAEKENYTFRVFSDEPRNQINKATPDEMLVFERFQKNPTLEEIVSEKESIVSVYKPIRLLDKNGCMNCHGDPASSPWGNGEDILGYKMENWSDGKLHGVFTVSSDVNVVKKASVDSGTSSSTTYLAIFIFFGGLLSVAFSILVVKGPMTAMSSVVQTLSGIVSIVSSESKKVAHSSNQLSQATTEQATSLEETATSVGELSSMVGRNTGNAKQTAETSIHSQQKAAEGKEAVEKMMSSMEEITASNTAIMDQINRSNEQMGEIVKVIQEIGAKTKVINDIVFQTKLLSFNASVEAARAGEQGKGFAVVAQEVGNLAQMSGNAAEEISGMLSESISKVESIVQETKSQVESLIAQGKVKVEAGVTVAERCGSILSDIVTNVTKVSTMAEEISSASQEQSQGITAINTAISKLDAVTHQNAASSAQTAQAAENLAVQAESLGIAIEGLTLVISGSDGSSLTADQHFSDQKKKVNKPEEKLHFGHKGSQKEAKKISNSLNLVQKTNKKEETALAKTNVNKKENHSPSSTNVTPLRKSTPPFEIEKSRLAHSKKMPLGKTASPENVWTPDRGDSGFSED